MLVKFTAEENSHATTHVAMVDTTLSPKHGVIQEGHCQPGTDPTPQTSQTEQRLACRTIRGVLEGHTCKFH
jgi:hypothetical protein